MPALGANIGSASISVSGGSAAGTALMSILMADDIQPGSLVGYETAKVIYLYHPLGAKMVEKPVRIALSQERELACGFVPGDYAVKAFKDEWKKMGCDQAIFATRVTSKIYGIASLAMMIEGVKNETAVDPWKLWKQKLIFQVYDPLNTAGSLVLNQNPLASDFQHAQEIAVQGSTFHRSRARVIMNEFPIYISYTPSAFGFVGRSVYQRSLFPLKSFIQTMITNDMISVKAGTIVAKIKSYGAAINNAIRAMVGLKRNVVQQARVGNTISIGTEEDIQSLDLKNLNDPFMTARKNIIEDIASGAPMPAKMLTDESFAQGFADGTEDAKDQARYIDEERKQMQPLYDWLDDICMRRAWNPEWYATLQLRFPATFKKVDYETFFFKARESFTATWPSLLTEPDSEKIKVADVKFQAMIAFLTVLMPKLDAKNFVIVVDWIANNMNEMRLLFGSPLNLDMDELESNFKPDAAPGEDDKAPGDLSWNRIDSADKAITRLQAAAARLVDWTEERKKRMAS